MRFQGTAGLADIAHALTDNSERANELAALLGYEQRRRKPEKTKNSVKVTDGPQKRSDGATLRAVTTFEPGLVFEPLCLWQPTRFVPAEHSEETESEIPSDEVVDIDVSYAVQNPPRVRLSSANEIITRLRTSDVMDVAQGRVDVQELVQRISQAEFVDLPPRLVRRAWGNTISFVFDRSEHLIPYWQDQRELFVALRSLFPMSGIQDILVRAGDRVTDKLVGQIVLAHTDLGSLAADDSSRRSWWSAGERLRDAGKIPIAVTPCCETEIDERLQATWNVIPVEPNPIGVSFDDQSRAAAMKRLMTLLAFVIRLDWGMLRAVRRLLPETRYDPGMESLIVQSEYVEATDVDAARLRRECLLSLETDRLAPSLRELRNKTYDIWARFRQGCYPPISYAELVGLENDNSHSTISQQRPEAIDWFRNCERVIARKSIAEIVHDDHSEFLRETFPQMPARAMGDGTAGAVLHKLRETVFSPYPSADSMTTVTPSLMASDPAQVERRLGIWQDGGELVAAEVNVDVQGSLLSIVPTKNGKIKVSALGDFSHDTDSASVNSPNQDFWEDGKAPKWASNWGHDEDGLAFSEFEISGVVQRMRWIPPGEFMMGSHADEEGRQDNEGLRHQQVIKRGFWMMDTPCTQDLWQAVIGENPSWFKSRRRPVEWVSWNDCQRYATEVTIKLPGLTLFLPSEGQWEYACRAGTKSSTYAGDLEFLGNRNSPVLDSIAWYGGNCGVDFDLKDGRDTSDWQEMQYEFSVGGTREVKLKEPNRFGLYDMLGNVWEWCKDLWREDYSQEIATLGRVFRGGSWFSHARYVRAASRHRSTPDNANFSVGFRCVEFQSSGPAEHRLGRAAREERQGAARDDHVPASPIIWLEVDGEEPDRDSFTHRGRLRVETDLFQSLDVESTTRPRWAEEFGRDRFGLWAELRLESVPVRFRWIPPGSFDMGSPENEAGRMEAWDGTLHREVIPVGFWMMETPVTQKLWTAVMGENPSEFKSPYRPVESVSWDACQQFLEKVNPVLDRKEAGFSLGLPAESQWEYACRAGTQSATYAGDLEILGDNNAPILDEITWYGGNCGKDFDLEKGRETSDWPEKQYGFDTGGTREVKLKRPNGFGLYDTLGNVWEWCADHWCADYGAELVTSYRVVRGGSWSSSRARFVRAACRCRYAPDDAYFSIGFRCVEFKPELQPRQIAVSEVEP
ncbi:MAG: formylglycine-generating enzyme family protein [Planctomycetota bacterium]